ncbi:MAG TPA: pyridoxal-dependent decarboxylase [Pyrinomonadaceae bacterium]|jgi:glutamate/tyrosine decarboxylase-like PLP-dependent enzyme
MGETKQSRVEETLDPQDWEALRALGHRMVDDMLAYLENVRDRPVWQPIPDEVRAHFRQPLPVEGEDAATVYEEFLRYVLPHPQGNIHPRFWGWVIGTGTPTGMLAEMLAAGMNPNVGGGDQVSTEVEGQVLEWCKQMLGFTRQASGLLVSGGSMANLVGLTVARNARADFNVAQDGVQQSTRRLTLYASREAHSSVQKSVELLGLGNDALRRIPVNAGFQVEIDALLDAISEDRARGYQPFCIVGNAGTVNTGAFDDLNRLADVCRDEGMWLHVDGAFGALAALSAPLRPLVAGMERADSLAFDLHKWMYVPYEAGCVLVRHADEHHRAFSAAGAYLSHAERGLSGGALWFSEYGVQLSRGFRALKIWMSLKEHGIEKYGRLVQQNVEQARYLAALVKAEDGELELLAPVPLNIVCFRYRDARAAQQQSQLNRLNEELLARLQESGIAAPSSTVLDGSYALRVAITNHRSRREDFDLLVGKVLELGRELARETASGTSRPSVSGT